MEILNEVCAPSNLSLSFDLAVATHASHLPFILWCTVGAFWSTHAGWREGAFEVNEFGLGRFNDAKFTQVVPTTNARRH